MHAIRDNAKQLARRALHRKRIPAPRCRDLGGGLEQRERVAPVRAQRTIWRDVHVVPFCAPSRAAYHARECCGCGALLGGVGVSIRAPAFEGLCEGDRARGGRSVRERRRKGDVGRGIGAGGGSGDVPCEGAAVGAAPGVVGDEGSDDGRAEEAYCGAGVGREEEGHEGLWGEVGTEVVAGVDDAY